MGTDITITTSALHQRDGSSSYNTYPAGHGPEQAAQARAQSSLLPEHERLLAPAPPPQHLPPAQLLEPEPVHVPEPGLELEHEHVRTPVPAPGTAQACRPTMGRHSSRNARYRRAHVVPCLGVGVVLALVPALVRVLEGLGIGRDGGSGRWLRKSWRYYCCSRTQLSCCTLDVVAVDEDERAGFESPDGA